MSPHTPPPNWPGVSYTPRPRLSPTFPAAQLRYINRLATPLSTARTLPPLPLCPHPRDTVRIKRITDPAHPAKGQNGLFAARRIPPRCKVIDYVGVIHSRTPPPMTGSQTRREDPHEKSDYDLSLIRCMSTPPGLATATDPALASLLPAPELIDIGIDADTYGNAARMINDYRGIAPKPNVEFRQVWDEASGWARMEVWSLSGGLNKGEEVLVSYGKGFWAARTA